MTNIKKIEFEEGCFDNLEDDLTQEEMEALIQGIHQLLETGEIFENAIPVEDLPEEEQEEIARMFERKAKRTRH
jgi:hypothetical protein